VPYEPWTLIDAGRESLWAPDVWIGVLELVGAHEGEPVYDESSRIYDQLNERFPREHWRAQDRGRFRPLFRDYSKPWTALGLASFDGSFQLLDRGRRLLARRGSMRLELAKLLRDYQEDGCFPFRLLAQAVRSSREGATFDFLYHDVCCRCRSEAELAEALADPSNHPEDVPDTPKRRLKLMMRLMERTGAVQPSTDSMLWMQWDTQAIQAIVGTSDDMTNTGSDWDHSLLGSTLNEIVEGVPGSGKSHLISAIRERFKGTRVVVMHPAMSYEDLVEGVRPLAALSRSEGLLLPAPFGRPYYEYYSEGDASQGYEGAKSGFCVRGGLFLLACAEACRSPHERFLVVLDELNRCNVPRALGELILCLEESKRWVWCEAKQRWKGAVAVRLPYSGLEFFVPNNLYVLGTLNSSDKSITALDQAIRRRFSFHRIEPLPPESLLEKLGEWADRLSKSVSIWSRVNEVLLEECGPDSILGHSYFFDAARLAEGALGVEGAIAWLWRSALVPQVVDSLGSTGRLDLLDGALQEIWGEHLASCAIRIRIAGVGAGRAARIEDLRG